MTKFCDIITGFRHADSVLELAAVVSEHKPYLEEIKASQDINDTFAHESLRQAYLYFKRLMDRPRDFATVRAATSRFQFPGCE